MRGFDYTYNLESFKKFLESTLCTKLEKLAGKRIIPFHFYKEKPALDAFQTVYNALGRFVVYKGKSTKDTYKFLKHLHYMRSFFMLLCYSVLSFCCLHDGYQISFCH